MKKKELINLLKKYNGEINIGIRALGHNHIFGSFITVKSLQKEDIFFDGDEIVIG